MKKVEVKEVRMWERRRRSRTENKWCYMRVIKGFGSAWSGKVPHGQAWQWHGLAVEWKVQRCDGGDEWVGTGGSSRPPLSPQHHEPSQEHTGVYRSLQAATAAGQWWNSQKKCPYFAIHKGGKLRLMRL